MRLRTILGLIATFALSLPHFASADPPAHAPAHGYRAKQAAKPAQPAQASGGIEVVFDSERGIHVAVGLPGVLFHDGSYYRELDGRWQVSVSGDGGWSFSVSSGVPEVVVKSKKHPGPAKVKSKKRK
jgi:hypothetical protein